MVAYQIHDLKVAGSSPASGILAHINDGREGLLMRWKALSVIALTLCIAVLQVAAGFEARAIKAIQVPVFATADEADQAARNMEVIKDHFRLIVCAVGALLGSAISLIFVIFRSVINPKETEGMTLDTRVKRTLYFVLSLAFSVLISPMIARVGMGYFENLRHPEVLLALAGFMAISAWSLMRIYDYCVQRFTKQAQEKGVAGLREEFDKLKRGGQ